MKDAFVAPKPLHGRVLMVNAASSGAGLEFAARHSDLIFITSPAGANLDRACEALPAHNARIKALARTHGREVRTIINPHVICRETEHEARAQHRAILEHQVPSPPTTSTRPSRAAISRRGGRQRARTG